MKYTDEQLKQILEENWRKYREFQGNNLKLDMSRGKPSVEQLNLSNDLLMNVNEEDGVLTEFGMDTRNYGLVDGIPELKRLFSQVLEIPESNIIIGGNSSLNLMFDIIAQAMIIGLSECKPWSAQGKIKFICPVPGYDRHFSICEYFGIEMVTVEMSAEGPDMDAVENLVKDPLVKGMWCTPKYSNPQGITYSDTVVKRIAALKPAAKDFRVFWDNAYCVHDLYDTPDKLLSIFDACMKAGNPNLVLQFVSTSKITFAGAGVCALAAGDRDIDSIKKRMSMQTICHDKVNQLRHARRFPNLQALKAHMRSHANSIRPKFDMLMELFTREFMDSGFLKWYKPNGGYFISVNTLDGCANRVVELCKDAGLVLTPAGATYPYKNDPYDNNIRIAPTFPPLEELELAAQLFCIAVKIASAEKLSER